MVISWAHGAQWLSSALLSFQPFLKAECGTSAALQRGRGLRQEEGGPHFPRSSPVQEVAGKLREEVGQVVVGGMGPRSEAQTEQAWHRGLRTWPRRILLCYLQVPGGRPAERWLVCDGRQRLWEDGGKGDR